MTDAAAFEYVHSINGKSIFIMTNNDGVENFKKLKKHGIIDEGFDANFCEGSDLDNFLKVLINFWICNNSFKMMYTLICFTSLKPTFKMSVQEAS